jgi:2-phospho-L-lactate transferase/gluconeogenesis factor (CofD/UPF0052 family)
LTTSGRLVRLIPEDPSLPETTAIKTLFNHRLSPLPSIARHEWLDIVEGRHLLWTSISSEKRELIRSFLNTINLEIVKRLRPTSSFNFQSASVGNLFLTGARLFTGSFESAIYMLGAITGVPSNVNVIPAINSNFSHHISAGLEDGTVITGQNSISHPSAPSAPVATNEADKEEDEVMSPGTVHARTLSKELSEHDHIEDANLPGSLPTLRKQYITFAKDHAADLPSRISRIWYINPYGHEIRPSANPKVLSSLEDASAVIYSIGSLYTSIIPCLILKGVGEKIASNVNLKYKILILNGSLDRETRAIGGVEFRARDFVRAIVEACAGEEVEEERWREFVSHVIHLQGEGTPRVEKVELAGLGVECVRIYGRKKDGGGGGGGGGEGGMIYDGTALGQALEAIIGAPSRKGPLDRSRRNTLGISGVGG